MKHWIKKHPLELAIALSVGLHVLAFILLGVSRRWLDFDSAAAASSAIKEPIVFDLIESPATLSQPAPPSEAKHLSDKNVSAHNPAAPEDLPVGDAYASGISPHSDYATTGVNRQAEAHLPSAPAQNLQGPLLQDNFGSLPAPEFRRELLLNKNANSANEQSAPSSQRPLVDNRDSRAPELGSFAINTYAWDFAPYLLWLKNRIEQNIFPPPAFTYMGMISGQTQLRFRIYPDGRLEALQVLKTVGHKSLMETSMRAVALSVPLRPLPADFPEEYLEVTALFEYIVQRR